MPPPTARVLVRGTLFNVLGHGVPLLVAVLCLPAVLHGYGTARFGLLALCWTVLGVAAVFDLGIVRASVHRLGASLSLGGDGQLARILATALVTAGLFGVLTGALVVGLAPFLVADVFDVSSDLRGEAAATLRWIAVAVPFVLVSNVLQGALHVTQRFDRANFVAGLSGSSHYAVAAIGAGAEWGLATTVGVIVLLKAVAVVALWRLLRAQVPGLAFRRLAVDGPVLRSLTGFGSWVAISSLTMPLLKQSERLLIPVLVSIDALTFYTVPFEAMSRAAILPVSMATALFPTFSMQPSADRRVPIDLLFRPLRYLLLLLTPALTFVGVFADPLLRTWIGASFADAATVPLQLLAAAFYVSAFSTIFKTAVQGLGRPDLKAWMDLLNAALFVALLFALMPQMGIEGAATARLAISLIECGGLVLLASNVAAIAPRTMAEPLRGDLVLALVFVGAGVMCVAAMGPSRLAYPVFASLVCAYFAVFWTRLADSTDRRAIGHALSLLTPRAEPDRSSIRRQGADN